MKQILAAVDGSDASYRALEHAAELSKHLDIKLTVLIVRLIVVSRKSVYAAVQDEEVEKIKDRAKHIVLSCGATNSDIVVETSRDTSFKIVEVAIDKNADLIVIGATGKSGFKAFMLGSVSQEVLKKSACPVTIVH